jgi:hypothetical protein
VSHCLGCKVVSLGGECLVGLGFKVAALVGECLVGLGCK